MYWKEVLKTSIKHSKCCCSGDSPKDTEEKMQGAVSSTTPGIHRVSYSNKKREEDDKEE